MHALGIGEVFEPPYDQWAALVGANRAYYRPACKGVEPERITAIRGETIAQAIEYTRTLVSIAKERGIELPTDALCTARESTVPILMTGHQPVVYHPGLLRKSRALSEISRDLAGVGIHVVIDTDQSDGGEIVWPKVSSGILEIKRAFLAEQHEESHYLFRTARLKPADQLRSIFLEIESDLIESGLRHVVDRTRVAGAGYTALAGCSLAAAHSIVRWSLETPNYLEVPLWDLITQTGLREVLHLMMSDGEDLGTTYNTCLDRYRLEHKIQNKANPFPNVKIAEQEIELPLWRICADCRESCTVPRHAANGGITSGIIAPKGSITTMLLRGFCSDLFIHGLGGGRYDHFVDQFSAAYLGVTLPSFVVASETRYLFPEQVQELERRLRLADGVKEIIARTEDFLGRGIFTDSEEAELRELVSKRGGLRERLQRELPVEERKEVTHGLNQANRAVRQIVESGSLHAFIKEAPANEAALKRWKFREFAFFMYPQ